MSDRTRLTALLTALAVTVGAVGCAKFNTFWNAQKAFDTAERVHEERLKAGEDVAKPTPGQVTDYNLSIEKCQKLLADYPGHGLTDDALFMMAKAYHRIQSYRMSISKLDLLFQNFPSNKFMEEALYLQAANHMLIGDVRAAEDYITQMAQSFPDSRFQAEVLRVGGDNAFALEHWDRARDSYVRYLASFADDENAPQAAYNLAFCHWKLGEHLSAHDRIEALAAGPEAEAELLFLSRLLQVRCLARLDRFEDAEALAASIEPDAEAYGKQGLLLLARGEALILQGNLEDAGALLRDMPEDWINADVSPLRGELLGGVYLWEWDLENAKEQYAAAVRQPRLLNDPDYCQSMSDALDDYVQAGTRMESASDRDLPGYKLTRANILYFHLDRPELALELYRDVASTAELDSSAAVRGLYGAAVVHRDHLAEPDSVAVLLERLRSDYPDAPQTFMLETGDDGDLYAFVMEQDRLDRETQLADADIDAAGVIEPEETATPDQVREPGARYSRWRERKLRRNS